MLVGWRLGGQWGGRRLRMRAAGGGVSYWPDRGDWGGGPYVVCLVQPPHADIDEEVKWRVVMGLVEQICQIESQSREVVCRIYGGVDFPQQSFQLVYQLLLRRGLRGGDRS